MIIDDVRVYEYQDETLLRNDRQSRVKIYPNPSADMLSIEMDKPNTFQVKIHSASGQSVFSTQLQNTTQQLDLSSLAKGLYYVTVEAQDFLETKQLIKL